MLAGPITRSSFVEGVWNAGADSIMLDLEDGVPLAEKESGRKVAREAVELAGRGGGDVLLRINGPWEIGAADLDAGVWPGLAGVIVPGVEEVEELGRIDARIGELEAKREIPAGTTQICVTIESVAGLFAAGDLASASTRNVSLTLGTEDFTRDIDAEPTPEAMEVLLPQLQIVLFARRAGISPLTGLLGGLAGASDLELARRSAQWARSVGFRGAACLSPAQVEIANEEFAPKAEAVARAERLIEAYDAAVAIGEGFIEFEGGIVDTPVAVRARRLIERAESIRAFDQSKASARAAAAAA